MPCCLVGIQCVPEVENLCRYISLKFGISSITLGSGAKFNASLISPRRFSNTFIERLQGSLKYEAVYLYDLTDVFKADWVIGSESRPTIPLSPIPPSAAGRQRRPISTGSTAGCGKQGIGSLIRHWNTPQKCSQTVQQCGSTLLMGAFQRYHKDIKIVEILSLDKQ